MAPGKRILRQFANKSTDALAVASSRAYVMEDDNPPRPYRLFICREAQGATSEVVEVGDLSRRTNKPDRQSSVYFETMATASRAGKEALKQLLDKLHSERLPCSLG